MVLTRRVMTMTIKASPIIVASLLILLLSACPGPNSVPSFELSILNDELVMVQGDSENISVQVLRQGGFEGAISLEFQDLPSGFSAPTVTLTESQNSGQLELTSTAEPATHTLTLVATSGSMIKEATLSVTITPPPVTITNSRLEGYGNSLQVRQGAGEISLELSGENLSEISSPVIDDLDVTLEETSQTLARFTVSIPHGAELGQRDLRFTVQDELLEVENVLEISYIHAAPQGSDDSGKGTPDSPFRTLTKALSLAQGGDTISLASGEYSTASGESWTLWSHGNALPGLVPNDGLTLNVAAGVSIMGEGATTVLRGEGIGAYTVGFAPANNVSVADLLMEDFEYAVLNKHEDLSLHNVRINNSAAGLWTYEESTVNVTGDSVFSGSFVGAAALNEATLTLLGTTLNFGLFGGLFSGESVVLLDTVNASQNATGIGVLGSADLRLKKVEANENTIGMDVSGGIIRVRGSSFSHNKDFGIRVTQDMLKLDLGTASDAGNNHLQNNGSFQFLDTRPEREQPGGTVIEMSETVLGESSLDPGSYSGIFVGENKSMMITFKNNLVQVY